MLTQEIKGNLAKLLATENLVVEHRSCSTASFDVNNRILTLPKWDRASSTVYDLLVGHEVGHALYTDSWGDFDCPKDYVNVTEDARIEKLMKRRYPGLRKAFFNGYREMHEDDFFGVEGENLDALKLIDRINLHFKIGASIIIPFSDEEQEFVTMTAAAETFDEAVAAAEKIWEFAKAEQKKMEELANVPQSGSDGGSSPSETQSNDGEIPEQQQEGRPDFGDDDTDYAEWDDSEQEEGPGIGGGDIAESDTQSNFDSSSQTLSSKSFDRIKYVDIPTINPSEYVVDWNTIHNWIDECSSEDKSVYDWVDSQYKDFKKSVQKEVNYLVKEFECKKAAEAYSRSMTSRTGVLDCGVLHTYKYSDDLFKKVTILPEGKNHGLLFILDWSGSMGTTLMPTLKQLMILCMFCKKVQIPFEVYAFTNEWRTAERAINNCVETNKDDYYDDRANLKKNEVYVSKSYFRMMNILSSRSNSKNWERQCINMFREVSTICYYVGYQQTIGMGLSGTPLNESILVMKSIIPEFKKTSGVSNINLCILTDGESCSSTYGCEVQYHDEEPHVVGRRLDGGDVVLRDRKLGRTYNRLDGWTEQTNVFINNLKETHPSVNVMGIRLLDGGSGLSSFYRRYCVDSADGLDKLYKDWKKTKSVILPNPLAYDALYVMSGKTPTQEATLDVDAGSSKTAVRAAFRKMLKTKQNNKVILNNFISQIA